MDEIQSTDLKEVIAHKVRQGYAHTKSPVLVDDVEVRCAALGSLPGPLIKWFIKHDMSLLCRILNAFDDRSATARVMYALYDGKSVNYFEGEIAGSIAAQPKGSGGFGWDVIFIPEGTQQTRAEQNEQDYEASSPRHKAIQKLKEYLDA